MNHNYYLEKQNATEKLVNDFFKKNNLKSKRNNLLNITDVDLIVEGKRVDVQFSQNFKRYGDIRIDLISAATNDVNNSMHNSFSYSFFEEIQDRKRWNIIKVGKYFMQGYADYVFYCIYDNQLTLKENVPSLPEYLLLLRVNAVVDFFDKNKDFVISNMIKNDKRANNIHEEHISAFIPISLKNIIFNKFDRDDYYYWNYNESKKRYQEKFDRKLSL